jgi:hypothetical protein
MKKMNKYYKIRQIFYNYKVIMIKLYFAINVNVKNFNYYLLC